MNALETLSVADRFALALDGLRRVVAARIAGGMMAAAMIVLVWQRLQLVEGRILRLLARLRAGRLVVRVEVGSRVGGLRSHRGPAGLPCGFAWLVRLVPYQAACFAAQIRVLLAEPEMVALLAAAPQARRVLAPLCRMLGIEAGLLVPAPAAVVVEAGPVPADAHFDPVQWPVAGGVPVVPEAFRRSITLSGPAPSALR